MLKVGTALKEITPEPGSRMAAFPRGPERIPRRAVGVLDPLTARALALETENGQVLVCSADLCILRAESVRRIRDRVVSSLPEVSAERIVVAVTHTHAGAETSFLFGATPEDPEVTRIEESIAETLRKAWRDREPARLAIGTRSLELTHNRRVRGEDGRSSMVVEARPGITTGPVDPELLAFVFTTPGGRTKAVMFHYTAHALTLGPGNDRFSADYPGRACRRIEEAFPGATALFLNGAAGNVHPVRGMRADPSALEEIGDAVGSAAVAAARAATAVDDPVLDLRSERLVFPHRTHPEIDVPVEIGMLRLGPLFLALAPGEVFVEHQLAYKRAIAPRRGTVIGYANGWPGYIPTRAAYPEGGYGVDVAKADPPRYSRTSLPAGVGETLRERWVAMALKISPREGADAQAQGD